MDKIKLRILGISYSQTQTGAYALILVEDEGKRRLPIIIGSFEAQSIAIELENMKPTRPLTHDLFKIFTETFDVVVKEIIIYKFAEGIFFSKLICTDATYIPKDVLEQNKWIKVISVSKYFAEIIYRLNRRHSIGALLD